jgi:ubiquinone/menaquinone biosynthesis C-methylase UbiE
MSKLDYHTSELEIALAVNDTRRVMPDFSDHYESLLDIGCGGGQTLIASELKPDAFICGIDIDEEALAMGRRLSRRIAFAKASGERLPFSDGSFDFVISRVSLLLMYMPAALRETARVLKPGGKVWFTLHPISMPLRSIASSIKERNARSLAHQFYVIVNGLLFHFTGMQFRSPFNRDRCESFQAGSGIVRAMRAAGFDQVRVERGRFFVVTASKRG